MNLKLNYKIELIITIFLECFMIVILFNRNEVI